MIGKRRGRGWRFWVVLGGVGVMLALAIFTPLGLYVPRPGHWRPPPREPRTIPEKIVAGARDCLGAGYYTGYAQIDYPNGDVERDHGACSDVVVRSLRRAGYDLQELIHEDMEGNFAVYPHKWGLAAPDSNIDHRRVPNQMRYFDRHGITLTRKVNRLTLDEWQPGDIVYWQIATSPDHTGIISDRRSRRGIPLVIHNGGRCVEANCLTRWKIVGHYRYPKNR